MFDLKRNDLTMVSIVAAGIGMAMVPQFAYGQVGEGTHAHAPQSLAVNSALRDRPDAGLSIAERPVDADQILAVYRGTAPGSEKSTWREQLSNPPWGGKGGRLIRNVVQPTLAVFKSSNQNRQTGTAVIIAPGGGFRWLSIDSEGYEVARALAAQGVTAIVLKYRLSHTPDAEDDFVLDANAFLGGITQGAEGAKGHAPAPRPANMPTRPDQVPGIADGLAAVAYVRTHAEQLGIDARRVGMVGFSAGGAVALGALRYGDADSRPDFAGIIYAGVGSDVMWPRELGPVFLAFAADDPIASASGLATYQTLHAQNHPVELHVFNTGGHGFGLQRRGLTTDLWLDEFTNWLGSLGYLRGATPAVR